VRVIVPPRSRPDDGGVRRLGLSAAVAAFALTAGACTGSQASVEHSCGAVDKRFIQTAGLNMTALGIWASGYQDGAIDPAEMVAQARDAARRVSYTEPHDPSLRRAQVLIDAMFLEYGDAVAHLASGKPDAGKRMFRAYGLANFAREILVDAQPELAKRGCDVAALL
jgi:hypothetical protein